MDTTTFDNLAAQVEIPADSTISTTIYQDDHLKVVLFGFAAGQELSEHTASMAAVLHFVQGEAHVTLGEQAMEAQANTWIHMPPRLPHSITAKTPVVMLLLLLKSATEQA
jgi:quercetin dioxygenase-like cupin family protein